MPTAKVPLRSISGSGDHAYDCLIVKTVRDVGRSAEAIGEAVDDLCEYSNSLIAQGYDSRDKLFHFKNNI